MSHNAITGPRVAHSAGGKNERATNQTGGRERRVVVMASAETSKDGKWETGGGVNLTCRDKANSERC